MASAFYNDFLHTHSAARIAKMRPSAQLAVFGKHPAWNDHMEDIGLETQTLLETKRLLYIQGIGFQLDKNAWASLPAASALESYNHWFLWHRLGECLIGRFLPTRDGKGRDKYPLILAAHILGTPLAPAINAAIAPLKHLEKEIQAATTRTAVGDAVRDAHRALAVQIENAVDVPHLLPDDATPATDATGWARILHSATTELAAFAPGRSTTPNPPGRHLRLPMFPATAHPKDALLYWAAFWFAQLNRNIPVLLVHAVGTDFVDLLVGEPASPLFYCVRANREVLPVHSDIPYKTTAAANAYAASLAALPYHLPVESFFPPHPPVGDLHAILGTRDGLHQALINRGFFGGLKKIFGMK
ncbi:MAG: hypothetical protein LBS59_02845 [Puniceicoccales bacterium]|jgi:hypothetical protein|nr:hypothetical protein [Puniceicoccales bacterium]